MDKRFKELTERLVASGRPADHFSCRELHELYDGIKKLEVENKQLQNTTSNSNYAKCTAEVLNYIRYSIDSKAGSDIQDIIKKHFA